ncbi:39809_t:CDS:2 [Gigaspora margarita]|uniref:39809_t:CDS:1 n=1 Tax=Gigaspora margarita TaxID=4874 RepID=A0ABM8VXM1_GIGMA|nr:39809_t:CDS:2 [Gigaspora margarita]
MEIHDGFQISDVFGISGGIFGFLKDNLNGAYIFDIFSSFSNYFCNSFSNCFSNSCDNASGGNSGNDSNSDSASASSEQYRVVQCNRTNCGCTCK